MMLNKSGLAAITAIALLLLGSACTKAPMPDADAKAPVVLEVSALKPAPADGPSRITLNGDSLVWEGDESLSVLFGSARDTAGGAGGPRAILRSVSEGRFRGKVDLNDFFLSSQNYGMENIKAISIPADKNIRFEYKGTTARLAIPVYSMQVQKHNGVLNGEYVPLFAWISKEELIGNEEGYSIEGKQLNYGCCLLQQNIYGTAPGMTDDEVFKSVSIQVTNKAIAGTGYWFGTTFSSSISGNISTPVTVALEEECRAAGRTAEECLRIYASVLPRHSGGSSNPVLSKITVTTDKARYEKTVSVSLRLDAGHVLPLNMDLGTFVRTYEFRPPESIQFGIDSFTFNSYAYFHDRPITVYTYLPDGDIKTMPILFAMHGSGRTAFSQITTWRYIAEEKKVIVIAPLFDKTNYPNLYYQHGNVSWSTTLWNGKPRELYTYNIIEALFDYVKADLGNESERYDLWGHSAGSQFSHRMMLHMPDARAGRIVCSNAGFYTVPDPGGISDGEATYPFPFSILGTRVDTEQLRVYFGRDLTVHLGTADLATTLEQDDQLPVSPGAKAQGACRYERGQFFYKRAKTVADSLGLPFNWKYVEVEGVAHSSRNMARNEKTGAAVLLYSDR